MSWGISRWGAEGGVPIGALTAATQTTPAAGFNDARGYGQWNFQLKGTISAGGVTVQGSLDNVTWFDLAPDTSSTSTGLNVNPITSVDAQLRYRGALSAVRGVSNGAFTGSVTLLALGAP